MQPLPLLPREKLFNQAVGFEQEIESNEKKKQRQNRFKGDFSNTSILSFKHSNFTFVDQSVRVNSSKNTELASLSREGSVKCFSAI